MAEWKDLLPALVTLIATFAGAWTAFRFESHRRKAEEDEKRIGAANRALYVVYHYWNLLEEFRKAVIEPHRGRQDAWLNLAAHPAAPIATDRFQPNDLQFLLQVGHVDTYVTLMLEEQRVMLALNLIAVRSELVLNDVFPRMASADISVGQPFTSDEIEHVLGVDVTHKLKELTASIFKNVDEDLASLKAAHDKMRSTMKSLYPGKSFLQVVFEDSSVAA
jgi:hypothetical protein